MYLRKSRSDAQFESVEEVVERHEKQLQEFCMRVFKEPIPEENIFREVVSGETIDDRPEMKKLLALIEGGEVASVIVIEPQRLSRGSFGDIDRIVNTFRYSNCKVVTPTKSYDLNDKFDRKYFEQELLRGNDYLEYVKEILVRGRVRSTEDGLYIGSRDVFGYDKKKLKKGYTLIPNDDADTVKYIFAKFLEGMGTTNIAHHLADMGIKSQTGKPWTPNMTRNILQNTIYVGIVTWGKRASKKSMKNGEIISTRPVSDDFISAKGLHEPLISQEDFDKAQEMLKYAPAKNIRGDKSLKNPLAGLIKCKFCGSTMVRRPYDKRPVPTLVCKTYGCNCVSSDLDAVENRVIELLHQELANYKYYVANYEEENKSNASTYARQIKKIDNDLAKAKEDLQNALIKYNQGKITEDEYIFLRKYTLDEQNRLKTLQIALNEQLAIDEVANKRKAIPILEHCLKEYPKLSIKDRHDVLKSIISKIEYSKTEGGRWNEEARNSFELTLYLKI
jgi:hypothetical protein